MSLTPKKRLVAIKLSKEDILLSAGKLRPMDPQLYKAAQSGNCEIIQQYAESLDSQMTPNKNTVLHVLAQFCDSSFAVEQILALNHSLLNRVNAKGETALHIAAKKQHSGIVRGLIDCEKDGKKNEKNGVGGCKKMLCSKKIIRMVNEDGDTALHLAVVSNSDEIVELLVKEDPEFLYSQNKVGESPLYLAVERGYDGITNVILKICRSLSYQGPRARTALHPAAIYNFEECMKLILEKLPKLTKMVDMHGHTALHLAARFGHQESVRLLLSADKSTAYVKSYSRDGKKTALHVAVIFGHLNVVKEILSHCPDCWEKVTGHGQNILHLAVKNEQQEMMDFILHNIWTSELINQKDINGDTPLHLYAATKSLLGQNLVNHPELDKKVFNWDAMTALDKILDAVPENEERQNIIKAELENTGASPGFRIVTTEGIHREVSESNQEKSSKIKNDNYLIIATLIVTVTFAAGFTIPGGYESNEGNKGMAVLNHKFSFIIFMVADSLALTLAIAAVFMQFQLQMEEDYYIQEELNSGTKHNIKDSMVAMLIAFVSGVYAVVSSPIIKVVLFLAVMCCSLIFARALLTVGYVCTHDVGEIDIKKGKARLQVIPIRIWGKLIGAIVRFRNK